MILFLRSSDLGIDSRLRRYCRALRLGGIRHSALVWDRSGKALGDGKTREIRYLARYEPGNRMTIGLRLLGLNLFALRTMWRMRNSISLVHAVDMDTAVAAMVFNVMSGTPYIYDVYDHYPDSRGLFGWKRKVLEVVENYVISKAERVILADADRTAQHGPINGEKLMIIQNVPDVDQTRLNHGSDAAVVNLHLKIGYLGTLEPRFRGLEDMLTAVSTLPGVELHIAGAGALENEVAWYGKQTPRSIFYGALAHHDGLAMLARCDVVLGLYYSGVANHKYAAPNKYFEHLLLGKPMLTSLDTPPGTKVAREGTGWVIADGAAAIVVALTEMLEQPQLLLKRGEQAAMLWQQNYSDYFERELAGLYVDVVRSLSGENIPTGQVLPFPSVTINSSECAG